MKNKRFGAKIISAILVLCTFCSLLTMMPITASAATTTPYYRTYGSSYKTNSDDPAFDGPPECFDIYMYGDSKSGTGTLYDNAIINWNTIHVYLDAHEKHDRGIYFYIQDVDNPKPYGQQYGYKQQDSLNGGDKELYYGTLPDGNYYLYYLSSYTWNILFVSMTEEYSYNFYFTVDTTPPVISGASKNTLYTNKGFTASASDATSGVRTFYVCKPGESVLTAQSGSSITIPAGSANGYYHILAYDNAGNKSDYCYVYYDNVKPTGTIKNTSGSTLTGTYTNAAFKYTGSDSGSGVSSLQYKKPGSSSWETYNGGNVTTTMTNGKYQFRTIDKAGNTSVVRYITLDSVVPYGTLYGGTTVIANGGTTTASYVKFVPADATSGVANTYVMKPGASDYVSYSSGTQLTTNGTYRFYCTDNAGNMSAEYTITKTDPAPAPVETYTVTYHANGGSGAPASQTKIKNVTLTLSNTKPTRSGYTFLGWSTSSSATSATYSAGGSYTANASVTLYAVWQKIPSTYTISYHANGGSGAPASQTKTENVTLTLSSTKPTRSGYTFLGWSTSSSATSATYSAGGSYTANASVTLYAVWQKIPATYTISYHANGGSGAPASQTKTENVTLTLSSTKPTRSGYTFLGWSTSSTATYASYSAGGSYTSNSSATLYAVWSKNLQSYTISYNANGGSGAPASQTKIENAALTLSTTVPTRTGYNFIGWSTSSSATVATYQAGGTYTANASATLYAVWEIETYTVSYDANGGSGAPASQTKVYDQTMTISSASPSRDGYKFLGWSESSTATTATYSPGGSYTSNASTTLYAVWQIVNYDFSVSSLSVSPSEVEQYGSVKVSFRLDSWDRYNPYSDIPVEVLLNGVKVYSTAVDFSAYGIKNISFDLNVGASLGTQRLEVRVNWEDHTSESRTTNNTASTTFNVKELVELAAENVSINGEYIEGHDVISSFYVRNEGSRGITPDDDVSFSFEVYSVDANGNENVIVRQTKSAVVVPGNETNIVYFKWTVPTGSAGKSYYCRGTVTAQDSETNKSNNVTRYQITVEAEPKSQTADTRYEETAPSTYNSRVTVPNESTGSASWNEWVYENNDFVLKSYGISVSSADPVVTPSVGCTTAVKNGSSWKMKSGYGITISYMPSIRSLSGFSMPTSNAYTDIQTVYATFPEYSYSDANGKCRVLDYKSGSYQFVANPNAYGNERVHFIPVYVKNGDYTVSVTATHIWTPAGMITAVRTANTIVIDGTIYSDWYQG